MTQAEAAYQARTKFGRDAVVWQSTVESRVAGIGPLRVGIGETSLRSCIGHGWTWEQALKGSRTTFMP